MRRFLPILGMWLLVASPALAQGPDDQTGSNIYDSVVNAVAPVVSFLNNYAVLASQPITATSTIWGSQLLNSANTGQGPSSAAPPADYYADAPSQIRNAGYTLDGLISANPGAMSALDFAHWLGVAIALPFQLARGTYDIAVYIGPLATFLAWLFLAVLWVGIVHFLSFLIGFVGNLLELGSKIIQSIELFKP